MKILILSDIEAGGEWIATQTLIEKLRKKNERLKFYLITSSKNKSLLKESLFKKIVYLDNKKYSKPFKHYREFFYLLASGKKTISCVCKQHKFDCVITTNYILAISYLISQKKSNYIYFFHGISNNYKIFINSFNHYVIFQKILEVFAWAMGQKLIVPSINARNVLNVHSFSLLKNKASIIVPNLIRDEFKKRFSQSELSRFKKNLKIKKKKIVLYSGRLASDKGIENLIYAFLAMTKKNPKVVLIILYPNKPKIEFLREIRIIIGKRSGVLFINNPPTKELSILYQTSDLAILPSPFEISSLFIHEALMSGLPIISTNTGDAYSLLSKRFILKDNVAKTIHNKINDYFNNEREYKKKFLEITKKFKLLYNEKKIMNRWIKILK